MKRLKVMRSHTALAMWLAETADDPIGWMARCDTAHIPSPYRSGPSVPVYGWKGRYVVCFETAHRRYEVFEVPGRMTVHATDEAATDAHIAWMRGAA